MKLRKKCKWCGTRLVLQQKIYCSKKCYGLSYRGEKNPRYRLGKKHTFKTRNKMHESGLKRKPPTIETRKKLSEGKKGKKNHFWQGGTGIYTKYGSDFSYSLKQAIRERDKCCQICDCTEQKSKRELAVHHIDYDKQKNSHENLVALCFSCHNLTGLVRVYWGNQLQNREVGI